MIQLSDEELKKLHEIHMEMLLEVKRICEKNQIKYSLIGGTLLGAVRHQGFIPWDDDVDVGMLRRDYERFRKACRTDLDFNRFYFQDDRNTKGYRWGYGKLRKKNTLFQRENQEHLDFGQEIFIDIFPLDYVPDNLFLRRGHALFCFCVRKMLWSPVGTKVEKDPLKRQVYSLLSRIPKKQVYKHYYRYLKTRKKSHTVRLNLFPTKKPYGFPKRYFEELIDVAFEGVVFKGSRYFNEYLTIKYGNYMELPPVEQRKVHPVTGLKF